MFRQVVHFKRPDREVIVEISQGPNSLLFWLDFLRHLPNPLHDLCIPEKIMNELAVRRPEKPFTHRSVSWMCPGARFLGAAVVSCQRLKVDAVKLSPPIYHHDLR